MEILIIITIASLLFIGLMVVLTIRLNRLGEFRLSILDDVTHWSTTHIKEIVKDSNENAFTWCWYKLADFDTMLYSIRPLTREEWLTPEMIEKLKT